MKINLLKYREQKNLTLAALSEMTGLGTGRLSEIETGVTSDPRISTIIKIADALDVTLDELVGRKWKQAWGNLPQKIKRLFKNYEMGEFVYHRK